MEAIDKELENKQIEKSDIQAVINEVKEPKPKVKKPRSEAQIKAFEKARAKRMENLKLKEQAEQVIEGHEDDPLVEKSVTFAPLEEPLIPRTPAKKKRGRPKGVKNKKVMKHQEPPPTPDTPYYPQPVQHPIPQAQPPQYQFQGQQYHPPPQHYYQPPPQQAPVNNYYYYGAPPPAPAEEQSEEEEEYHSEGADAQASEVEPVAQEEEPEIYQPALKYRFV